MALQPKSVNPLPTALLVALLAIPFAATAAKAAVIPFTSNAAGEDVSQNDVILNALGVTVTLNKEVLTGTSKSGESFAVDAIDVSFNNVLATLGGSTGLLNGTIDIGSSSASVTANATAVPEPATLALLAGSIGVLFCMRRARGEA